MRTWTGSTGNWDHILGGDGFFSIVDYTNSNVIYAEYQWGWLRKSINGGSSWDYVIDGIDIDGDRHNWNTPVVMDPVNHEVMYYATERLYKTVDGGGWWDPISNDLTNGPYPTYPSHGTICAIDVGWDDTDVIYVGTDDGNIWVSKNGGSTWDQINTDIPDRWVTRVTADPRDASIVYATISGYHFSDHLPHIFRSINYGETWTPIHGNLPDAPINDVIPDPHADSTLWIGTDYGVYVTYNLGNSWEPLGDGIPIVPVYDLVFHPPTRSLVAGTHGRSMFRTVVPCPDSVDTDEDGLMNACDNCPTIFNPDQEDLDRNQIGDACEFICGDANSDQTINVSDAVWIINYVFAGGDPPDPLMIGDSNCDTVVNVSDAVWIINYVFVGGNAPCDPDGDTIPDC
jgi:Dockerin type I domain